MNTYFLVQPGTVRDDLLVLSFFPLSKSSGAGLDIPAAASHWLAGCDASVSLLTLALVEAQCK